MQWSCKTWRRNGFKAIYATPTQLKRRREISETSYVQKKPPRSMYTENTQEVIIPCEELNWTHERSMPRRSETNGIAERVAQGVKEGTSSVSVQSGLQECWWAEAMECYCYLRNGHESLADSQTPYERRFLQHLKGRLFIWSRSKILSKVIKKTKVECISSVQKSFLGNSLNTP